MAKKVAVLAVNPVNGFGLFQYLESFFENGITYKVTTIAAKAFKQNKKLQSVTVGANVKSISNNAFFKCLSLKTVNLKTVLLTSKTASKKAFKGANKKLVIKVPKKVKKSYKKIFKGLKVK